MIEAMGTGARGLEKLVSDDQAWSVESEGDGGDGGPEQAERTRAEIHRASSFSRNHRLAVTGCTVSCSRSMRSAARTSRSVWSLSRPLNVPKERTASYLRR